MVKTFVRLCIVVSLLLLHACAGSSAPPPPSDLLSLTDAQSKIRSYQVRTFEVGDREQALRGVIRALLDLGFIVERVNGPMGLVTAGKFSGTSVIELTSIVNSKSEMQTEVRVSATHNKQQIDDPKVYQNFFAVLQRSFANPS